MLKAENMNDFYTAIFRGSAFTIYMDSTFVGITFTLHRTYYSFGLGSAFMWILGYQGIYFVFGKAV